MKSFRYSTQDFIAVLFICCVIAVTGFVIYNSGTTVSYSKTEEKSGVVDEEAAILDIEEEEVENTDTVVFTPDTNKALKPTQYSLDMVYESIRNQNGATVSIDSELNDIYQHFYDYFDANQSFINVLGEKYTYDEYMFVTSYSLVRNNTNMFGMYLITYSKCDVFSSLENHSRDDKLSTYCVK